MNTNHAPCVNLVTVTISSTSTVMAAPSELIHRPEIAERRSIAAECCFAASAGRSRRPRSTRRQCLTMPICPSENDTNTPMM